MDGGQAWTRFAALDNGTAPKRTGIFRAADEGKTWDRIGDYPPGIFDWIGALDGDKDAFGKVCVGFAGAGLLMGRSRLPGLFLGVSQR